MKKRTRAPEVLARAAQRYLEKAPLYESLKSFKTNYLRKESLAKKVALLISTGREENFYQQLTDFFSKAGLTGLRFHDLRHYVITELAKSGASDQTLMSITGHVSRKMLDRYSHIRMQAKRNALEVLSNRMPNSYGTIEHSVPVYTDLSSTGGINRVKKKLEVATVPEKRPPPKFRTEW